MADEARVDEQGNEWVKAHNPSIDSGTKEFRKDYFDESLKEQGWKLGEAPAGRSTAKASAGGEA